MSVKKINKIDGLRVNLGCGRFPEPGFVNVDWSSQSEAEIIHDLNKFSYPFEDCSVSFIQMNHVLEHLNSAFSVMKEINRILKPGGEIVIRVPHFSRGFTHPEHQRGFDFSFPFYFDPQFEGGYCGSHFEAIKTTFRWFSQGELKSKTIGKGAVYALGTMGWLIDCFANFSPGACSKLWCYWVGGFDEIEFHMSKPVGPR